MEQKIINIKELAYELNTTPKALRKWLRDHNISKPGKRWEWPEGHEDLEKIKQLRNQSKQGRKKAVKAGAETAQARNEEKRPKEIVLKIRHQPSGGKEWVAEIVGRHPRFNFERKFLKPVARNWSSSGKTGITSFLLQEGKVYEVNEPWKGRYFVKVENGKTVDVTIDDIKELFKEEE